MATKLQPPPNVGQDINSRQWKDWLYSIYASFSSVGGLGTMASQNANNVVITGGTIGGVALSGDSINNTPIGAITPSTGAFTNLSSSGTVSGTGFSNYLASPPAIGSTTPNRVNTNALKTTGLTGYLYGHDNTGDVTASTTVPWSDISSFPHIEAYDLSSSIALTATPILLAPASTVAGYSGITYNSSTAVFTFTNAGSYGLAIGVNAIASATNQFVYIWAENYVSGTWVVNPNSGKAFQLVNNQLTQIVYSQAVYRTAGQQVRYWIYSNNNKVTLQTYTLPSITPTVYVPAIRIQYS